MRCGAIIDAGTPVFPRDLQLNPDLRMLSREFVRRLFQLVTGAALAASFLFPLIEYFDKWDSTAAPSNDTEPYVLCTIVGIAIVFALRSLLRFLPELLASDLLFLSAMRFFKPEAWLVPLCTTLNSSPPVPLKI
jgi:hypothetical protein